jgi:signal transduction histidine kinase
MSNRVAFILVTLPTVAAGTAIGMGSAVLLGWLLHSPALRLLHPAFGTMSPPAAWCFIALGIALWYLREEHCTKWKLRIGRTSALLVVITSAVQLAETWFGWTFAHVVNSTVGAIVPWRMPTFTALAVLSLALALLLLDVAMGDHRPAELLAFTSIVIVILSLIAYVYGSVSVVQNMPRRAMAFHTLLLFLLLAAGILTARTERGFMRVVVSNSVGGIMMRRMMPFGAAIAIVLGWLVLEGQRSAWYPPILSLSYYASLIVVVFSALVWITALSLHRIDLRREKAEGQIRRLNAELEQRVAARTAELEAANGELEAFSYSVSHDLRAPLRHISGFIQLLERRAKSTLDEESKRYIALVESSSREMGCLIDDLLAFSRMGRSEMMRTRISLHSLADRVIKDAQPTANGAEWILGDLPEIDGDPAMLQVVLVNLVSNAVKFSRACAKPQIEIGSMAGSDSEVVFFVRDNGAGFDMRYAHKLFGVFQRLHSAEEFEGTGIGLATIRRIIHRHGGRTWAEGDLGKGATFYCALPSRHS